MKQFILTLLLALSFTLCNAQRYDTTNFIQVTYVKIEPSMKAGHWVTVQYGNETRLMAVRNIGKPKDMVGSCVLLSLAQWNDLLKNKIK